MNTKTTALNHSSLAGKPEAPIPAVACGNCEFAHMVPEDFKVIECRGLPPTPAIVGMGPNGPAIAVLRPRLPRSEAGCALHRKKPTIING
jgi:hypothetical protein